MCRQLGFSPTGALAYSYAHFGRGVGPITLDNVQCTGLESYLTDCSHNGLYIHNCGHGEDAGVRCQGKDVLTQEDLKVMAHLCIYLPYLLEYRLP